MSIDVPIRGGRSRLRRTVLALLIGAVTSFGLVEGATGQVPTGPDVETQLADLRSRATEISPRSGPPGTRITLRAADLPAITPVHLAIGGTRSGFEALAFVRTDQHGDLVETVEVPAWAAHNGTHRFIIFDAYFAPLSITDLFHVTDAEGRILREGEIIDAGPTCARMAAGDSEVYSFVGETDGLETGRLVLVEATLAESAACEEGIPIEVVRVRPLDAGF